MIKIEDLTKSFNSKKVLNNLNLQILPQQRIALVGHNGCGKTTLIRCILGLYCFEGNINVFGIDIKENRDKALNLVAFVPQNPPALRGSLLEILNLMSKLCNVSISNIEYLANELGLDISKSLTTPFNNLSGGMKQKFLIAIAMARQPSILIMDEPSANLDPKAREVFFKLLANLPDETSMLLTSHRIDELAGIASRVIEIDDGRITIDDIVEAHGTDILTEKYKCIIGLKRIPFTVKTTLLDWGFKAKEKSELEWNGIIPAADSFRFHAILTRWSGLLAFVSIDLIKGEGE